MATRGQVKFAERGKVYSNVYTHYDSYPDGEMGRVAELKRFFADVKDQCKDTRFGDAEYLAAKYIVWKAIQDCTDENPNPLNFLGIGPCLEDHGDIEYVYLVDCSKFDDNGFPLVDYKKA